MLCIVSYKIPTVEQKNAQSMLNIPQCSFALKRCVNCSYAILSPQVFVIRAATNNYFLLSIILTIIVLLNQFNCLVYKMAENSEKYVVCAKTQIHLIYNHI